MEGNGGHTEVSFWPGGNDRILTVREFDPRCPIVFRIGYIQHSLYQLESVTRLRADLPTA